MAVWAVISTAAACGGAPPDAQRSAPVAAATAALAPRAGEAQAMPKELTDALSESPRAQRERHCAAEHGQFVEELKIGPCQDGRAWLSIDGASEAQICADGTGGTAYEQCLQRDADGNAYFSDGPSVPDAFIVVAGALQTSWEVAHWKELFWPAATHHDWCYAHNGISRGLTQRDCDDQMLHDLSALCAAPRFEALAWFSQDACETHAAAAYAAVRSQGRAAFETANTQVAYPEWQPLWRLLGLDEDVSDPAIVERVNHMLDSF